MQMRNETSQTETTTAGEAGKETQMDSEVKYRMTTREMFGKKIKAVEVEHACGHSERYGCDQRTNWGKTRLRKLTSRPTLCPECKRGVVKEMISGMTEEEVRAELTARWTASRDKLEEAERKYFQLADSLGVTTQRERQAAG
jgi:hypothetical protein